VGALDRRLAEYAAANFTVAPAAGASHDFHFQLQLSLSAQPTLYTPLQAILHIEYTWRRQRDFHGSTPQVMLQSLGGNCTGANQRRGR
jgi:hypothetical protein